MKPVDEWEFEVGITLPIEPMDRFLAQRWLRLLHHHYPHYRWTITIPPGQGVGIIRNLHIGSFYRNYGFVFRLDQATNKRIVEAGGEILERYRMEQNGFQMVNENPGGALHHRGTEA